MNLAHVVIREMRHRKLNAGLTLFSVAAATACLVAALALLRAFDVRTEQWVVEQETALRAQMADMEDQYRLITKRMGFNLMILPRDQDLADFYAESYADKLMPEEYAERLAQSRDIVTIRHLLPMLQQKLEWPEQKRKILLTGVRGEMPWAHRANLKPLLEPVPPDTVVLGYELHRSLGLKVGDAIVFMGHTFTVHSLHPERGTIDDITMWIDLIQAQQLLDKAGRINAIMALECKCAFANLPKVRAEIEAVLPDTQVVELAGKALARAEARQEAEKRAQMLIEREVEHREELRRKREAFFALLVPLVVTVAALWVGLLAFGNVRERRMEVGILGALGVPVPLIALVFLLKAFLLGLLGAALGVAAGLAIGRFAAGTPASPVGLLCRPTVLAAIVAAAPITAVVASWLPALAAAHQDPAGVLREE